MSEKSEEIVLDKEYNELKLKEKILEAKLKGKLVFQIRKIYQTHLNAVSARIKEKEKSFKMI